MTPAPAPSQPNANRANNIAAISGDDAEVLRSLAGIAKKFGCSLQLALRSYTGNHLRQEVFQPLAVSQESNFTGATWRSVAKITSADAEGNVFDLELELTVVSGSAASAGVGVMLECRDWSLNNYLFMPAAIYHGNDFEILPVKYPPLWRDENQFRTDMPVTVTDLPRIAKGSRRLEQTTGDVASPCMGFYAPATRKGVLLFTTQQTELGNSGLTVELDESGTTAQLHIMSPCVRTRRQTLCTSEPSTDQAADWRAGDQVKIRLRLCFFEEAELQGLFDFYAKHRKALNCSDPQNELPFSAAWKILEQKYNAENWDEAHGYYKMAPNAHTTFEVAENPLCFLWQLGWVGGGQVTLPMLFQGTPQTKERAWKNLEMIFGKTQAPSGFFYGIGDGKKFYSDGFDRPHPHELHMVRKSADWLFFALKQFDVIERQGMRVPVHWLDGIVRLAEAFVTLWESHGQFGQFVDVSTGKLLIGGSCAGGLAPAGLAMASVLFCEPHYLAVAQAAARKYYEQYVRRGIINGGPGEILSAPDSEAVFSLIESFVKLYEVNGDPFWLRASRDTVRQASTWVVAYDYKFPPNSDLARSGARTTGAVWANVQNKHGAPAICTLSGDALLRLWRASHDPLALELLHDIAHGIPQYLSRADRPLNHVMRPGWMCERVNLSDWEGAEGVGGKLFGSCWPEVSLMLTTMEIPGLYVQPDTGFFHVFDHVNVTKIAHSKNFIFLRIENPTSFDAEVRVLCESSKECKKPLPLNPLFGSRRILVPAHGQVEAEFHS